MSQKPTAGPALRASLIDRLLGAPDGRGPGARGPRNRRVDRMRAYVDSALRRSPQAEPALEWVIAGVKEDLRCLLNTLRDADHEGLAPDDPLHRSLLTYGVTDFSERSASELRAVDHLPDAVRDAILRFEPRLEEVKVEIDQGRPSEFEVRLRVRARLRIDKAETVPVGLDTVMSLSKRSIDIEGGLDGREAD